MAEDLTTYTEVDPNSHLSATTSRATGTGVRRDESCYLYSDKGAGHFDALDIDFDVEMTTWSSGAGVGTLGFSNSVANCKGWGATDPYVLFYYGGGKQTLCLNTSAQSDFMLIKPATKYYCTLERAAGSDTANLKVYSDALRTTLLDTLTITGVAGVKWRYIYAIASWNAGGSYEANYYCENINIVVAASLNLPNRSRRFNPLLVR